MSNFTDETYVPSRITYRAGGDPGAIGAGKIWVDASVEPPTVKVRNKANDGWDAIGGGGAGGAVTAVRKTFTHTDLEGFVPTSFLVTSGNGATATVVIAGDHTAVFPVGGSAGLSDNAGTSQYLFNITSSTFDGTHTTVVFSATFTPADPTGLFLLDYGQAGTEIYTPTNPGNEYVLAVLMDLDTGLVNGVVSNVGIHIGVYSVPDRFIQQSLPVDGSGADFVIGISDAVSVQGDPNGMLIFGSGTPPTLLHANGITITVDDANGGDPGAITAGQIRVTIIVVTATDA